MARLLTITPTPGPVEGYDVEIPDELYEALLGFLRGGHHGHDHGPGEVDPVGLDVEPPNHGESIAAWEDRAGVVFELNGNMTREFRFFAADRTAGWAGCWVPSDFDFASTPPAPWTPCGGSPDQDQDGPGRVDVDPAVLAEVFDHALHDSGIASLLGDPEAFLDTLVAETLDYKDVDDTPTVTDARIILDRALDVYSDADGDGHADLAYFDDAVVEAFWNSVLGSGIVHD